MEKTSDGEAPLLFHDGIEFASCDRPVKLLQGRASFRLKISQVLRLGLKNCCLGNLVLRCMDMLMLGC